MVLDIFEINNFRNFNIMPIMIQSDMGLNLFWPVYILLIETVLITGTFALNLYG